MRAVTVVGARFDEGMVGKLLERNGENEKAVVQFLDDLDANTYWFDDICEYRPDHMVDE
jgi:hypothetical protein